jgi:hypothetical protein
MTEFIDFNLVVRFPRREFVGLRRHPMPDDLDLFMRYLNEAVVEGKTKHFERYGFLTKHLNLQIQRGHVVISRIRIQLGKEGWKIKQWNTARGTGIHDLRLQWKYLEKGLVASYFEARDRNQDPQIYLKEKGVEAQVFGVAIKGLRKQEEVMESAAFKIKLPDSPTERVMQGIATARLRTPITHTR